MKIIYIANARIPTERAHGLQIIKMCEAMADFDKQKINLELIIPFRVNRIKDNPFDYYNVKNNFKITHLSSIDIFLHFEYIDKISRIIQTITFYLSVIIYLLFKRCKIIYTRDEAASLFLWPWRKKIVWEAHNLSASLKFLKKFINEVRCVVSITSLLKQRLVENGINEKKIIVAPDGVDLKKFEINISKEEARAKLGLPPEKQIILYTGHLYEWKGTATLLEAARKSKNLFIFVGGMKEDVELFKSKIYNLEFNIQIVGHRPHGEIPYWLKSADVLVLPNSGKEQISREFTSPLKLFEYMASGRPIVASRLPALEEILQDRENAILFTPDDPHDLSEKIGLVLNDSVLAKKISQAALAKVSDFGWDKRVKKILSFCLDLWV